MILSPEDRLFILTGAGISAESGIQTFRDVNGLWEGYDVTAVASPEGWRKDPQLVWRFYSERRRQALQCEPNAAHHALHSLEGKMKSPPILFTQNVDNLHQKAGSTASAMHGDLFRSRCTRCVNIFKDEELYLDYVPTCRLCGSAVRPQICWFGEEPFALDYAAVALRKCTVLLSVGTSGSVFPAAGFPHRAQKAGARTVYVGLEEPLNAMDFDEIVLGKASEVLPPLLTNAFNQTT